MRFQSVLLTGAAPRDLSSPPVPSLLAPAGQRESGPRIGHLFVGGGVVDLVAALTVNEDGMHLSEVAPPS